MEAAVCSSVKLPNIMKDGLQPNTSQDAQEGPVKLFECRVQGISVELHFFMRCFQERKLFMH